MPRRPPGSIYRYGRRSPLSVCRDHSGRCTAGAAARGGVRRLREVIMQVGGRSQRVLSVELNPKPVAIDT